MITKATIVVLSGLMVSSAIAQEHCTAHTITERWLQANGQQVDLAHEASMLEQQGVQRGGVQTVPVAVHVVWNNATENVSDGVIQSIIAQMNADYQAMNTDYSNVRSPFLASRGNAQIEFCLATTDASGNATTGITRYQTTKTWFNPDTETDDMKASPGGTPAWNPSKYLNIWICDISSGATGGFVTAGYAYLPVGGVVGAWFDGLVLDYQYGTNDRTASHEVGHYFGLPHPWGDGNGNCTPGDGISDTPSTDSPTYSCGNTNLMKCNTLTQYENFMDYSNCPVMFTNGQATVMAGVLNGVRSSLLSSSACSGGSGLCIPTSTVGTADGDFIDGVILEGIQNVGTGSTSGPTYNDYTMHSATLAQGETYTLLITNGEYYEDMIGAWIDFDGDGQLSTAELIGEVLSSGDFQIIPFEFTVPMNALPGNTIMRVRAMYPDTGEPQSPDPCANFTWGETEDYSIVITTTTGVSARTTEELTLRTFPDHVVVSWPNVVDEQRALVLDAAGRVLMDQHVSSNQLRISTTDMAAGIYQLVVNLEGERMVARFVVAGQ